MTIEPSALRHDSLAPSPWMLRYAHLVPPGARVLDLACGFGRHARLFAQRGAHVLAVDRDRDALSALEGVAAIETRAIDLEASGWPFADERFDAIVVSRYLHRPTLPQLIAAVADEGTLLYETFARGNAVYGRPSNPDFLLEPGELLALAAPHLTVVAFEQGLVTEGRPAVIQRVAAVGRRRQWPSPLDAGDDALDPPRRSDKDAVDE